MLVCVFHVVEARSDEVAVTGGGHEGTKTGVPRRGLADPRHDAVFFADEPIGSLVAKSFPVRGDRAIVPIAFELQMQTGTKSSKPKVSEPHRVQKLPQVHVHAIAQLLEISSRFQKRFDQTTGGANQKGVGVRNPFFQHLLFVDRDEERIRNTRRKVEPAVGSQAGGSIDRASWVYRIKNDEQPRVGFGGDVAARGAKHESSPEGVGSKQLSRRSPKDGLVFFGDPNLAN